MTRKAKNTPPKRLGFFGRVRRFFIRAFLVCAAAGTAVLVVMWNITPDVRDISPQERNYAIRIYAGDGQTLIGTFGDLTAEAITADNLPQGLVQAITASEDRRFFWHPGLDPEGLARALVNNLTTDNGTQGGSTITQQFAKLRYLNSDRTLTRKAYEAVIALKLEWHHSKEEILAAYMNEVYAGSRVYGLSGAANRYFNKSVHDLTTYESAVLAGIVQAPSRQNPARSQEQANRRARSVVRAMAAVGHITEAESQAFLAQTPSLLPPEVIDANNPDISYFTDWIGDELTREVDEVLKTFGGVLNQDIEVYTTLDLDLQKTAADSAQDMILSRGLSANASQVAAVVMDQRGAVLAMVGGTDYRANQFNRATDARRQPGSTFKLFVYLAALARGMDPTTPIQDVARNIDGWVPRNYNGQTNGTVELQDAFRRSLNIASANLSEAVGRNRVRRLAAELMDMDVDDIPTGPSVALGAGEVTLIDLVAGYGAVSTGGMKLVPFGVEKIITTDPDGERFEVPLATLPQGTSLSRNRDALGHMNIMLRQVVANGTGRRANIDDYTYGKTGTTSSYRDAWFVGFEHSRDLGNLIAGVWMGNDDQTQMDRVTGGSLPAELWKTIVSVGSPLADRIAIELPTADRELDSIGNLIEEADLGPGETGFDEPEGSEIF